MAKKQGLGTMLDSIFDEPAEENGITALKLTQIEPNQDQARKRFDTEKLNQLADSIAEYGVIQPLTVRPFGDGYQIVAGERRWRAARIAGLSEVPVRIMELSDVEAAQVSLIENLQREDLNPIEEAAGYQELIDRFSMKQEEIAKKVGKARSSIANSLRLLSLPEEVRAVVADGELSRGHCKALMGAADDKTMIDLAGRAIKEGISVHTLEKLVKASKLAEPAAEPAKKIPPNSFAAEAEISLTHTLGKPVKIVSGKKSVVFTVTLSDEEDLKNFLKYFEVNE